MTYFIFTRFTTFFFSSKFQPKSPTLVEIPEEQETITLDDSDEDQNKTIVLKEEIKRDSIQIIHEDPVSTVSFKY